MRRGARPEEATGRPSHKGCGDQRGDRDEREQQAAVGDPNLEVTQEPQVEPEPPAEEREAHGEEPERRVTQRGNLPEPRQRVRRREVLVADGAVVVEHLLDLGSTAGHVAQPTGLEREHRGQRGEDEESGAPFRVAVEQRGARGHDERPDDETDDSDRDVDREHHGSRSDRERVGEQRALDGDGCEHARAGEGEDAEELPAVEGRAREQQREDRHREQDTEDMRAVRGRTVGEVPEGLRQEHDRQAGQDRHLHEEAEAEVVLVCDLRREQRGGREDGEAQSPDRSDGDEQRSPPVAQHRSQRNRDAADTGEVGDVDVGRSVLGVGVDPTARFLVEHRGGEGGSIRRVPVGCTGAVAHVTSLALPCRGPRCRHPGGAGEREELEMP